MVFVVGIKRAVSFCAMLTIRLFVVNNMYACGVVLAVFLFCLLIVVFVVAYVLGLKVQVFGV